ncbi:DUF2938 domain-containing protein [Serratia proteamaculans]|uniref:DUF2938 domain-containing protein n=1 Tax=Serratia proteamaculans TaxID=28151 RepID=UPI00217AFCC4|nr:DUF2938 domain-containing protein [Serratia proteamaculans]CAI1829279.1 Protein of uncharacterised function (DUF2938) [Serratia proteamaculans]CAI2408895.1 Protein of uncharacterised function (DUF2938) [Serratia proteamaculans]
MVTVFQAVITGICATLVMDLWSLFQKHIINVPPLNYALVGRWVLWMPRGKLRHKTIVSTSSVRKEFLVGWVFHYLTGILFAFIPFVLEGPTWISEPSFTTALLAGLLTLVAPFLILQPAFGFGIAASRTPRPWLARLLSVLTHLAYGLGLYIAVLVIKS